MMPDRRNVLEEAKRAEAEFFTQSALRRTAFGQIPFEADLRRATRFVPRLPEQEPIDPLMTRIIEGRVRDRFIDLVARQARGRVLDIGCGPGWLALELGRRGQTVDAYDLSPEAIALAKRMLEENPYRDGFGQVNYYVQDVTQVELGSETFDAVAGWSAFHHLPDLPEFMGRVHRALKPGGIVATFDDLSCGRLEQRLRWGLRFLLPVYERTYLQKFGMAIRYLRGRQSAPAEVFSPMESVAEKHTTAAQDIAAIWHEKFETLWVIQFDAFSTGICMSLSGPDWFRYAAGRVIVGLDRTMCKIGACKGMYRILIARKKPCRDE